jgi:DNA-binding transcriptional regulator YdaS (Cro superfamily)
MGRRTTRRHRSPLGEWLELTGTKQKPFAARLASIRGARVHQSNVSQWATGEQSPSDAVVVAIELATDGAVPRTAWECWRRRNPAALGMAI